MADMTAKMAARNVNKMCIITEKIEEKEAMRPKTRARWGSMRSQLKKGAKLGQT